MTDRIALAIGKLKEASKVVLDTITFEEGPMVSLQCWQALVKVVEAASAKDLRNDPTMPGAEAGYEGAFSDLDDALTNLSTIVLAADRE